ncbi:MAG: nicotinamidase/pyrazinamidase [Deltaproteobacteria bacterium]|nr:MAG: nicotinamidase/pyrazinamidase [Deltaproteobacteria bacterium]
MKKTLILVDVQNDFSPTGALPVPDGDAVVPVINRMIPLFDRVIATKDWHPAGHASFASVYGKTPGETIDLNGCPQILWPDHCVQGTVGADFIPGLQTEAIQKVILKGTHPEIDSYSGFFDNAHKQATGLEAYLKNEGVSAIYIAGLATDYCVKFTALDARALGLKTFVIQDACRAVNMAPGDGDAAVQEMADAGCEIIHSPR